MIINTFLYECPDHLWTLLGVVTISPHIVVIGVKLKNIFNKQTPKEEISEKEIGNDKSQNSSVKPVMLVSIVIIILYIIITFIKYSLVEVPLVEGMIYSDAIQTLNENKIYFEAEKVENKNEWEVVSQSVNPWEVINKSKKLELTLRNVNDKINVDKFGDLDNNGIITPVDASQVLSAYIQMQTGVGELTKEQLDAVDINGDELITPSDASLLLSYYVYAETVQNQTDKLSLEEFMNSK